MDSDFEKFIRVLFHLTGYLRERMAQEAWVFLGVFLLAGILVCGIAVRWISGGGLARARRINRSLQKS